eukprot:TRINITY_DN4791_c3_g1_i2.p1 TRINITY_DN4791_c3_g1~~TRINITY_DN4791_c3_g1_i2.p1  ORF type:complete len:300 (+),score=37.46 TRINITY_DN4791_c3_g1_i2:233-1132(+)
MLDGFLFPVPPPCYTANDFPGRLIGVPVKGNRDTLVPTVLCYPEGKNVDFVLLCLHANASDIGGMESEGQHLADKLSCLVVLAEYPGYGLFEGSPSMSTINAAAWSVLRFITDTLGFPSSSVVLLGRSIGTGVASRLAARAASLNENIRGVVLVSPYTSVLDLVSDHVSFVSRFFSHRWRPDVDLLKVACPLLMIHGAQDTLIPLKHFNSLLSILKKVPPQPSNRFITLDSTETPFPHPVCLRLAEAADHNRWDYDIDIVAPLRRFISEALPTSDAPKPVPDVSKFLYPKETREASCLY